MLIAHISDPHVAGPGKKAYNIAPTAENLARCVEHINRLEPRPQVVLITGDITYSGAAAEAENAAQILQGLRFPFYLVPGNHDRRETLWAVFGERACPSRSAGFISYVIPGYDLHLIGLDSTVPGAPGGKIDPQRADWLDEQLARCAAKPTVLFMHHPPVKCGVLETDEDGFEGVALLGKVIARHAHVQRILCGHIHLEAHAAWQGTVVSTAPSTGMQLVLDLTMTQPSAFVLEAPGYQLHYWTPEGHLVSHTVYVRDVDGPYLFEEYPEEKGEPK